MDAETFQQYEQLLRYAHAYGDTAALRYAATEITKLRQSLKQVGEPGGGPICTLTDPPGPAGPDSTERARPAGSRSRARGKKAS